LKKGSSGTSLHHAIEQDEYNYKINLDSINTHNNGKNNQK
jgi:formiminotetrahydrofolate cyclodeaminase